MKMRICDCCYNEIKGDPIKLRLQHRNHTRYRTVDGNWIEQSPHIKLDLCEDCGHAMAEVIREHVEDNYNN